jgi:hypothetical protein
MHSTELRLARVWTMVIVVLQITCLAENSARLLPTHHNRDRIVVGAIRWDAWHGDRSDVGTAVERSLGPRKWHVRLPFFAKILSDSRVKIDGATQSVMDQEIRYARFAGLDYWAFVLYDEQHPMSLGLKYYLSSSRKGNLRFCLIIQAEQWSEDRSRSEQIRHTAELMTLPEYQKVAGGRPLLYWGDSQTENDTPAGIRTRVEALEGLKALLRAKGQPAPYVVILDWRPERSNMLRGKLDADAISAYSFQRDDKNGKYAQLAGEAEQFWEDCRNTGTAVVPIVMTGWDRRPRVEHPVFWETYQKPNVGLDKFYNPPTPSELSQHLGHALTWVNGHPDTAPAKAVLIYAWNENDEGGWLVPTLQGGNWRIRAVRGVLLANQHAKIFSEYKADLVAYQPQ